ncbi:type I-E CRISPR-associated protein Cse1/CasA [Rothia mucilaginosa]|uniref:type I-E CRISPR-associated protein Cse1/CasA n=1 Tax=Rothia mucilaginosa TaxID=43675 RepID=UPI0028DC9A9B|nr:type I-E CRISPR-associated protein Cse1/CasA [Rothia mucilaginosa]
MTSLEDPKFNLVDEPWIPVLLDTGESTELSLHDFYGRLYDIRKIRSDSPLTDTAILGMVLVIFARAVCIDADNRTADWVSRMREHRDENLQDVLDYLDYFNEQGRFWLLGGERPFMQVHDLHTAKGDTKPVSRLILDSESEYFSQRAEATLKSLSFAEAARYLVTLQAYDYSGIKSGAVGDPRVKGGKGYPLGVGWYGATGKVIVHGDNMMETLLYNLDYGQLRDESAFDDDLPVWEREEADTAAPRAYTGGPASQYKDQPVPASGMCEILTWQSRRIRLHHDGERVTSVLVANGDKWLDRNNYADPLTGYRYSKNQSSKTNQVWMPQPHSSERTLWRGADALLTRHTPDSEKQNKLAPVIRQLGLGRYFDTDSVVDVQLVGVEYGTQNSVIENVISDSVQFDLSLLTESGKDVAQMVCENIKATMDIAVALGQFAGNLLKAAGKEYEFQADVTESLLYRMEDAFRQWVVLQRSSENIDFQKKEWQDKVRRFVEEEADFLTANAGPKAMMGTMKKDSSKNEVLYNATHARRQFEGHLRKHLPLAYKASVVHSHKEETNE